MKNLSKEVKGEANFWLAGRHQGLLQDDVVI